LGKNAKGGCQAGTGTVTGIHVSTSGQTVVVAVCQCGFVVVKDGKPLSSVTTEFDFWSHDDEHDVLTVKTRGAYAVSLYTINGDLLARLNVSPEVNSLLFSQCGCILAVTGSTIELFRLSWTVIEPED
jgi:hypothetical protein